MLNKTCLCQCLCKMVYIFASWNMVLVWSVWQIELINTFYSQHYTLANIQRLMITNTLNSVIQHSKKWLNVFTSTKTKTSRNSILKHLNIRCIKLVEFLRQKSTMGNYFLESDHFSRWQWHCTALLIHWGLVTHICVSKIAIIGSENGLSPDRRQAIIWTNAEMLLIGTFVHKLQCNCNRNQYILSQDNAFEYLSANWRPFFLGLNLFTEPSK